MQTIPLPRRNAHPASGRLLPHSVRFGRRGARLLRGAYGTAGAESARTGGGRFPFQTKPGDPNLLSCTPTLEMGINIGDLSSLALCSVPPKPSNYLQRAGRAGRVNGNSFVLTVANARPHDLYFYFEPEK